MNKDGTYNGPKVLYSAIRGKRPQFFRNYYPMFVSFARNFVEPRGM